MCGAIGMDHVLGCELNPLHGKVGVMMGSSARRVGPFLDGAKESELNLFSRKGGLLSKILVLDFSQRSPSSSAACLGPAKRPLSILERIAGGNSPRSASSAFSSFLSDLSPDHVKRKPVEIKVSLGPVVSLHVEIDTVNPWKD